MAICKDCNREMLTAKGCAYPWVKIDGKWYHRLPDCYADPGERCGDCGAIAGDHTVHHQGCDNERCPKCGGQFFGCECNVEMFARRRLTKKDLEHDLAQAEEKLRQLDTAHQTAEPDFLAYVANLQKELADRR